MGSKSSWRPKYRSARFMAFCLGVCVPFLAASLNADEVQLGPNGPQIVKSEDDSKEEKNVGAAVQYRNGEARISRIRIRPAAEPTPALRYTLVPDYLEVKPGNAAPYYYRAIMRLADLDTKKSIPLMQDLAELPVERLGGDDVAQLLKGFDPVLSELRVATHREHCDWDWRLRDRTGEEQISFLLAEIQEMRTIGRVLSLKAGHHLAKGEFEEAIDALTIGYQMAKDVGKPAMLINDLVGIAIASVMNARLVELIDLPDSPNLYWAIASLPRPLVSMRDGFQHERALPYAFFPALRDPDNLDLTKEEWRKQFDSQLKSFIETVGIGNTLNQFSAPAALMTAVYPRAKRELVAAGYKKNEVEAMPVAQVIAVHESRALRRVSDNMFKWSLLPYHEADSPMRLAEDISFDPFKEGCESLPIASLLLPAVNAAAQAEVRLHVELDGIRAVEALRMQMAQDNRLPAALEDVSVVPVPVNPATNRPFVYRPILDVSGRILELIPGKDPAKSTIWQLELVD